MKKIDNYLNEIQTKFTSRAVVSINKVKGKEEYLWIINTQNRDYSINRNDKGLVIFMPDIKRIQKINTPVDCKFGVVLKKIENLQRIDQFYCKMTNTATMNFTIHDIEFSKIDHLGSRLFKKGSEFKFKNKEKIKILLSLGMSQFLVKSKGVLIKTK